MSALIYHYTDSKSARGILRDGRIKAVPQPLHLDVWAGDAPILTRPLVWFTTRTDGEPTVAASMYVAGWPDPPLGHLWRFAVAADMPGVMTFEELIALSERDGVPIARWEWVVRTARLGGVDPAEWRIVADDVPRTRWERVQRWAKSGIWMPVDAHQSGR